MRYSSKPSSFLDLQQAIKHHPQDSPCLTGCRSVCWKILLLFRDSPTEKWAEILSGCRSSYTSIHEKHLRFIKHPELLAELPVDPLADDPDSPWELVRKDELIRSEILQDVQRLPDDPLYHQDSVQAMILDILFLYCKLNPGVGGYRQGMHELLAPIVHVLTQDALDRKKTVAADEEVGPPLMLDMLDSAYVEHDAYTIFSMLMARASAFYEVGSDKTGEQNTIVEKSRHIHDELLMQVDPELASHLKEIEILPQIFLIRWIRLLFGREFPFEQLLVLWDTIFALDPNLDLIDLICVAMLLRIRWTCETTHSLSLFLGQTEQLTSTKTHSTRIRLRHGLTTPPSIPSSSGLTRTSHLRRRRPIPTRPSKRYWRRHHHLQTHQKAPTLVIGRSFSHESWPSTASLALQTRLW